MPAGQSQAPLPPKWTEAVQTLASKIALACGAPGKISLDVKNVSSLTGIDTRGIRQALKDDLTQRRFHFALASSAETQIQVTLSEGAEGFVWVAEVHHADARQVAITVVPKSADGLATRPRESVSLDRKLVWEQQTKILDFALPNSAAGQSATLIILEPARIVFYHTVDSQWQLWRAIDIPHPGAWPRDLRGSLDASAGNAWVPGVQCSGDFANPERVECSPQSKPVDRPRVNVPGHEGSEAATMSQRCGSDYVMLASGTGDWTQPDSIQAYVSSDSQESSAASGDPLQFDGPVVSLQSIGNEGVARAVSLNLKTGSYEAYIVTATCNY